MSSLNEFFGYEGNDLSLGVSTYSELEGALKLRYQVEMTVTAKLDNLSSRAERKLVSYMMKILGYSECRIDRQSNTIYVYSTDGVTPASVRGYIRKHIDPNVR